MNRRVQQLQYALQMLALPVTAQLHLHGSKECQVEEVADIFNVSHQQARQALCDQLTGDQGLILTQLEQRLRLLIRSGQKPAWQETALRSSAEWRQIRGLARRALTRFDWPLEVPPVAHVK